MSIAPSAKPTLHFPEGYSEGLQCELEQKMYCNRAEVIGPDGDAYPVYLIALSRLIEEMTRGSRGEFESYADPGLIIVQSMRL